MHYVYSISISDYYNLPPQDDDMAEVALNLSHYVSSLPPCARPHLELELDWGYKGVETDLYEIAYHMLNWEEDLSAPMGLDVIDIHDITEGIQSLVLQR